LFDRVHTDLSARRNEREVFKITVKLVANEILELDLGQSIAALDKTPPSPRQRDIFPQKTDSSSTSATTVAGSTVTPKESNMPAVAPLDISESDASKTMANPTILGEEVVLGKRFVVQQKLVGHNSPVFRVSHLSDGKLISAERIGKPIQLPSKAKSGAPQSLSQIRLWGRDGNFQSLPNEGTLEDFLAAPNGTSICHIGRVFGAGLTVQLYKEGRSIWSSNVTTVGKAKSEMPYFAFSGDSDELLTVLPQGTFTRLNLRTGKIQPPVASLVTIDKSTVESLSVSQKLDHALFGLSSGELLVIRTRDGKQVSKETLETPDTPKEVSKPVVATQFNSKDNRIATVHSDGTIQLIEFPTLNRLEDLPQTITGSIHVLGRSTNGRFLVAIGDRMRISVYDLDEGNLFASWELSKPDTATSISIDNLGKRIAIGFESGSVALLQPTKE